MRLSLFLFAALIAIAFGAEDPLGGKKPSELVKEEEKTTGRCDDYCQNECDDFAWGGDTIIECNGCKDTKCKPGAKGYGDEWVGHGKTEL